MKIVGHRGARNLWPENSLEGFRQLIALGADAVEFDVQHTRDGVAVVIHDPTLDRTTTASGAVAARSAAEVLAAPLRDAPPGACVPSLADVLALFGPTPMELHVEIKTDAVGFVATQTVDAVVHELEARALTERSLVTCFVPQVLEHIARAWPRQRVLASLDHRSAEMLGGLERALARLAAIPGCVVAVQKGLLAAGWDACLGALGPERLGVWVVNETPELERWLGQPLRQLTTDRPDLALAARLTAPAWPGT